MLRVSAVDRCPRRQLFHRQIGPRDWALAPQKVFDFLGVLLQHSEIQVVKIEELADFVGESCSQLPRFAARGDRLADAHNGLITAGGALSRDDRGCNISLSHTNNAAGGTFIQLEY